MKNAFFTVVLMACATAQTLTDPPALVRVIRSPLQPYSKLYADAHAAVTVLGMTSISGPSETWLIEAHDSFAAIEDLDKAFSTVAPSGNLAPYSLASDDVLAPSRTLIALYRPGWSYRPEEALKLLPKMRYLQVSIYRNRSGDDDAFASLVKSRAAGLDSINLDRPDIAYEVISGAPSGTYLLLTPLVSLKTLDDSLAARTGRSEVGKNAAHYEIGREHLLFRLEPGISYVSAEFASEDPDFWSGKARPQRE
jgi:hypothetical protein